MDNITLTQEELDAKINEAVEKAKLDAKDELTKEHNSQMAQLRQKAKQEKDDAVKKAQEEARMSAEELATKAQQEEKAKMQQELDELRSYKKTSTIKEKLVEAKLPLFLANDSRLLNASNEDELKNAIETVKQDFAASTSNGSQIDTNVQNKGEKTTKSAKEQKFEEFRKM